MRKALLGVFVASWAVACTSGQAAQNPPETPAPPAPAPATPPAPAEPAATTQPAPAKPSMAELQKKNMDTFRAGWDAHDAKKVASVYSADAIVAMPGPNGWTETTGRDAIEKQMASLFAGFPDAKSAPERGFTVNDIVIVQWTFNGTHSGEYMDMKPTNKKVGYHGASVVWFNDEGMIKGEHLYFDHGTIMAQLGLAPKEMKARPFAELPSKDMRPEWAVASNSAIEKKNMEFYRSFLSFFEQKNEKGFLDAIADDGVYTDYTRPEDIKGKDGAKKDWATMSKAIPDGKATLKNIWAAGDYVISETEMSGTLKGALGPIKPTNKTGTVHMLDVSLIKDGKIKRSFSYGSSAEFAFSFGLAKPKAPPPVKATGAQVPAGAAATGAAKPATGPKAGATAPGPGTPTSAAPTKPVAPPQATPPAAKPAPPAAPPGAVPAKPPMTK